jgi:glycosyltransferase involved in cell wall biosynthesis
LTDWLSRLPRPARRPSRFALTGARPRIGLLTQYAIRKGVTTLARSIELALSGELEVFCVPKLSRVDRCFGKLRAAAVDRSLAHPGLVPRGRRLLEWLEELDLLITIERPMPQLAGHCKGLGLRVVLVSLLDWLPAEPELCRESLAPYDRVVVSGRDSARRLEQIGVRGVVEVPASAPWPIEPSAALGRRRRFLLNVGVGGALDRRNSTLVVRCFQRIFDAHPEAELIVKMLPRARKYLPDLRCPHRNMTLIEDELSEESLRALQRSVDASIFLSRFEGIGFPLLESLHCGVPVIATDAPPMNEFISDEVNGLLVRASAAGRFGQQAIWDISEEHFLQQVRRLLDGERGAALWSGLKARASDGVAERREAASRAWRGLSATLAPRCLNLGSGGDYRPGMINLDRRPETRSELLACARALPFPAECFDEVHAQDLLEHFPSSESGALLDEWTRVLRPGGLLRLQTPDMRELCRRYIQGKMALNELIPWIYGGQDYRGNFHHTGFDEATLSSLLERRGYVGVRRLRDAVSRRNICLVARRPGPSGAGGCQRTSRASKGEG